MEKKSIPILIVGVLMGLLGFFVTLILLALIPIAMAKHITLAEFLLTMDLTRKASGARAAFEQLVGKDALLTFDFDAPPPEEPEYRSQGEPDELGYVSDEETI